MGAGVKAFRGDGTNLRAAEDFYPTPPGPVEALLDLVQGDGRRIRDLGTVWEPAAGDGAMVRPLQAAGLGVVASDLEDRGFRPCATGVDFLRCQRSLAPAIITNPPYDLANSRGGYVWVSHSLAMATPYLALLLPNEWERSGGARRLLRLWPYSRQYQLGWRIDWSGKGRPANWHSWFVWDQGSSDRMVVRFLDRVD